MPAEAARQCLETGRLDHVPLHLRYCGRIVAIEVPPYDTNCSRQRVAGFYRQAGCSNAEAADMEFFVATPSIPPWATMGQLSPYQHQLNTRYCRAAGPCNVVLIGPALFCG
ncbi:hypothetical protein [Mesorhizobium sp. ISC15]